MTNTSDSRQVVVSFHVSESLSHALAKHINAFMNCADLDPYGYKGWHCARVESITAVSLNFALVLAEIRPHQGANCDPA